MNHDEPLTIGGRTFAPGESGVTNLAVGEMIDHRPIDTPVHVIRGKKPGRRLLVTAGLHGDEINGVDVIRRLLKRRDLRRIRGDLIAVPVVNIVAFLNRSRYTPDRRDLNRLFPGSESGSMGARLARALVSELADQCTHAIDLHTGATYRPNLPQIRVTDDDPEALDLAKAFGAPVVMVGDTREGSFRHVFALSGKPMLLFEGGEANRLDASTVRVALRGIVTAMRHLGMLPADRHKPGSRPRRVVVSRRSYWTRAPRGGLFVPLVPLGKAVSKDTVMGVIADPFGTKETPIHPRYDGVVIGRVSQGIADAGDGVFHIARSSDPDRAEAKIRSFEAEVAHPAELPDDHDLPVDDDPMLA